MEGGEREGGRKRERVGNGGRGREREVGRKRERVGNGGRGREREVGREREGGEWRERERGR